MSSFFYADVDSMDIEDDLHEARISHLDLSNFVIVQTNTSVAATLRLMRENRVSAALVKKDGKLAGIFTERDVLTKVSDQPVTWKQPVDSLMTSSPQTVSPDEPVSSALGLMNTGGYRDMPVLDADGNIMGNLSHPAIIRFLTDRFPREIYNLPPDPDVFPQTREGA